jgi:hypothetical protein
MTDLQQPPNRQRIVVAIKQVRLILRWKPRKERKHLVKRIKRGHLPSGTTLAQYEAIIRDVVSNSAAQVYVFRFGQTDYPTVVAPIASRLWLVMFSLEGVLETAFPPDNPHSYFQDPRYIQVGKMQEVLS